HGRSERAATRGQKAGPRGCRSREIRMTEPSPAIGYASSPASDLARRSAEHWTRHNVTQHRRFASAAESLAYLHWRNDQYPGYIELMPVDRVTGMTVLDFGCGPGNDLVGFSQYSKPRHLIGVDVSPSSLAEARERLKLHGVSAELQVLNPLQIRI